jgi:phospholipase/carboxylesterase
MLKQEVIGTLSCHTVQKFDEDRTPELVAIINHGFGAPGNDLVPLGAEMLRQSPALAESVRLIFPAAPLEPPELGGYGRAWWPLDVMKLQLAIVSGEFRDMRKENPDGLPEARRLLIELVNDVREQTGLPMSKIVLGGFSQGSMLATDVALHLEEAPGGLLVWSGTLLCEDKWRELAARRGRLRVMQSHGRRDPILPFEAALWLRDLFEESGFEHSFCEFNGEHSIPAEAFMGAVSLFESLL